MSLTGMKKSPLISLPYLRKRLRRITALGLRNLTANALNFTVHFTLHRNAKTVAFYTSESVENQRSPEWSFLQFPTTVQLLQEFLLRIWITSSNTCRLFLEYDIHLNDSLMPDEQKDDSCSGNNNTLWLEMFGYRFTDDQSRFNNQKNVQMINVRTLLTEKKSKRNHFAKSYNRASVKRLIQMVEDIHNNQRSAREYLHQLQTFFEKSEDYLSKIKERESRKVRVDYLKQHVFPQLLIYERRLTSNQDRQKTINEKKNRLEQNLCQLPRQQEELYAIVNQINQSRCLLHGLHRFISFRQKNIISEIYHYVYPITTENKTEFAIGNIKLPPAEDKSYLIKSTREREYEIEAAIGYCAHLVLIISQFLELPLRFPIEYHSATSIKIYDFTQAKPAFPLCLSYDVSVFSYALFLLNRDIGQIMSHCRVVHHHKDYRRTLENLKELMEQYFLKANDKPAMQFSDFNRLSISSNSSNASMNDRLVMRNKRNSMTNSMFSPTRSAISSMIEMNDNDRNEDHSYHVDLFPTLNPISPQLTMELSQQQ